MSSEIVVISEKAKIKMKEILLHENKSNLGIRVGVVGGGCSGLSYKIDFGEKKDNDNVIECESFVVYIDPKSSVYLNGVMIDFSDGLNGKGFIFKNPNATNTCGCGESFSL